MKTMHRTIATILVIVMILADCGLTALADSVLTMPAALQTIDEEAFLGSSTINKVVLRDGVKEIRARAFANSSLSEINLPASLTYIADNAFDGPDKVTVTAVKGTYAYRWAVDNGYITESIEAINITVSPDVLTLTVGDTYTLTADIVPNNTTESMTWSTSDNSVATVNDGTVVANAEGKATITAATDSGLSATCEVTVVRSIPSPTITGIDQDGMGKVSIIWDSLGSGYEYLIYEVIDSSLILLGTTSSNSYDLFVTTEGTHTYCLQACVDDDNGNILNSAVSSEESINVCLVWNYGPSIESIEQTAEKTVALTIRGVVPVSYYQIAEVINDNHTLVADSITLANTVINPVSEGTHYYAVRAVYTDQDNQTWIGDWSARKAIVVQDATALTPDAPVLLFSNGSTEFSVTENNAPEFEVQRFELLWANVENATEYGINLSRKNNEEWIEVVDETTKNHSYSLVESFFGDISEATLYRVSLVSIALITSEAREYFFWVLPQNKALLINGESSVNLFHTGSRGKTYRYDIQSQYNVTISYEANWLGVTCDNNELTIVVDDDQMIAHERNTVITLSNGYSEASINVYQWSIDDAPYLSNYTFSKAEDNPTDIPYGDISLVVNTWNSASDDGCVIIIELYQKNNSNEWMLISQLTKSKAISATMDIVFENSGIEIGKTLKLKTIRCGQAEYNTGLAIYKPNLTNEYYFRMTSSGHEITVNGKRNLEITSDNTVTVAVVANSSWTYSTQSDWITLKRSTGNNPYCANLKIIPTNNSTDETRTAVITLTCGSLTSTISFTQINTSPSVVLPSLSTKESSPTVLTAGNESGSNFSMAEFVFRNIISIKWEYKSGTIYIEDSRLNTDFDTRRYTYYEPIEWSLFTKGVTYRLTVNNGETDKIYYFRVQNGSNYALIKGEDDNVFKDVDIYYANSTGVSLTYTFKANASWTTAIDASWLHLSKTNGYSNTNGITLTLTIDPNNTNVIRHGIVSFKTNNTDRCFIRVVQNPDEYLKLYKCSSSGTITDSDLDYSAVNAGTYYVLTQTNAAKVTYVSDVTWITTTKGEYDNIVKVSVSANTTESSRTGHLTFTAGSVSETITITQVPAVGKVHLLSPNLVNTSKKNPGVVQYGDLTVEWEAASNAVIYEVWITTPEGEELYYEVADNGSSSYSLAIPAKKIGELQNGVYELMIRSCDAWNYKSANTQYFRFVLGDTIYIGGEVAPVWDNVTDHSITSDEYRIVSTDVWTAQSESSWMTISKNSGISGETFTVTLTHNTGAARSGRIIVNSGSVTGYLTVNQCAAIPEWPELIAPEYSTEMSDPTILPADTHTILTRWTYEPQATYYEVSLREFASNNNGRIIKESGPLKHGETQYIFDNITLEEGKLYWIKFVRMNYDSAGATNYYFTTSSENSYVQLDGETEITYDDDARGGGTCYSVVSSGVWNAVSDSNWLTVGKRYIDEEYLDQHDDAAENHMEHYGQNGETLYVYMLTNNTGTSRTGTVTVRSGSAVSTITFNQEKQYAIASLISPILGERSRDAVEIPYGPLSLTWSASDSGTGHYEITITESGTGRIYHKQGITSCSLTIPQSKFSEGKHYNLWLGSEIEDGDDYENGKYYYFTVGYQNALSVSAFVDWSQVNNGGYVTINAFAAGGAGGYQYSYQLLKDGEIEQETIWDSLTYYQFKPWSNGSYRLVVNVKDSSDGRATYSNSYEKEESNLISVATANHYSASVDSSYQFLDYSVLSQRLWSITSHPDWITPSVTGTNHSCDVRLVVAKNDGIKRIGKITFKSDTGILSDLTITQTGSKSIALSSSEETFDSEEQSITVPFAAAESWTATSSSSWATVAPKSGSSGNKTITVQLSENTGTAERVAVVTFVCDGDVVQYTIHQLGKVTAQTDLTLSMNYWQVGSPDAETKALTIIASGNWSIASIPSWIIASLSSGIGNAEITLYCSTNNEGIARTGSVVFASGNATQSISVSQPGNDVCASVISFTMSSEIVDTGSIVDFTVNTRFADQVQLLVDGVFYNKYPVTNNQAVFRRAFSQGGIRKVSIMPIRNGQNGLASDEQILMVNSNGELAAPNFTIAPEMGYVGEVATITIPKVNNADAYTIWIYAPDSALIVDAYQITESELESKNRKVIIPAENLLTEGLYCVNVIASGSGYSQSQAGKTFTLATRNYTVAFSTPNDGKEYVPGDTIKATINQTGGGYASIKVIDPNGIETWYPSTGNNTTTASSYVANIPVTESGIYGIYGYVFAIDLPASQNTTQKETYITVRSNGPEISAINIAEYGKNYTWIYQSNNTKMYITANNAVEKVTISDTLGGDEITSYDYIPDGLKRVFSVPIPNNTEGKHTITIIATDDDLQREVLTSFDFYIAAAVSNYIVYASENVTVMSSPINGTKGVDILGGAFFEPITVTHSAGDWLRIKTYSNSTGFVKASLLSRTVPLNASGLVEIVTPAMNETVPKGADNTLTVRWKSGVALNNQTPPAAIVKNLISGTKYSLNSSSLFSSSFDVTSIPDGQYSIYLQMSDASGSTINSNTIEFTLGGYSDEARYKDWFKNEIYRHYEMYMDGFGTDMGSSALRAAREAYDFIVGGYISDGDHFWKPFNHEELNGWITMDDTERKQLNLTLVSNLVLEDAEKAGMKLKSDLSNVSNVVATKQNNEIVKAKCNALFSALETGWSATQTVVKGIAFTRTVSTGVSNEISTDFSEAVDRWGERVIEMMKEIIMAAIEDYNNEALIEAYKNEYAKAMKKACQEYIDYLEITLFGSKGASSNVDINMLDDRQQAALTYIKAYRQYMNNPGKMKEDAVLALLQYCDSSITLDIIRNDGVSLDEAIKAQFRDPDTYGMLLEKMIDYLLEDAAKYVFERVHPNLAITEFTGIVRSWLTKLLKWDKDNHTFAPDIAGVKAQIEADAAKYGFSITFGTLIDILGQINVNKIYDSYDEQYFSLNDIPIPDKVKNNRRALKNGIVKSALGLCKSAWKTGNKIAGLTGDLDAINSQNSGRAMFEMYGMYMAGAIQYRLTYISGAEVLNWDWEYLNKLSIIELERKRAGLITLLNNDADILTYYGNMRRVNENAGWRFHLVLRDINSNVTDRYVQNDYAPVVVIDAETNSINFIKQSVMAIPKDIQNIITKYN